MLMLYGIHPLHLNKPKPLNRFSDVHAGSSLVIIFCHIPKRLVIARLSHWPLGGKTIALSLPKGLLILKGQRIFFHLLGWRVIPGIFAMLTRSPNCVLGLRVLKIALSLTSLSCWINNFDSLTLTSLHAYLSVYMFSNFMCFFFFNFFLCMRGGGGVELEWNVMVCVCEWEWCKWWVFAGECMCMSLFEFAFLGFEEEWDFLLIVWGFFFLSMSWLFLSVQYFDVFIDVNIFRCLVYIMQNVIFIMILVQSCVFEYLMFGF